MSIVSQVEDGVKGMLVAGLAAGGVRADCVAIFPGIREWDTVFEARLRTPAAAVAVVDVSPENDGDYEGADVEDWVISGAVILIDENLRGLEERARGSGVSGESAGLWRLHELAKKAVQGRAVTSSAGAAAPGWRSDPIRLGAASLLEGGGDGQPKVGVLVIEMEVVVRGVGIGGL